MNKEKVEELTEKIIKQVLDEKLSRLEMMSVVGSVFITFLVMYQSEEDAHRALDEMRDALGVMYDEKERRLK